MSTSGTPENAAGGESASEALPSMLHIAHDGPLPYGFVHELSELAENYGVNVYRLSDLTLGARPPATAKPRVPLVTEAPAERAARERAAEPWYMSRLAVRRFFDDRPYEPSVRELIFERIEAYGSTVGIVPRGEVPAAAEEPFSAEELEASNWLINLTVTNAFLAGEIAAPSYRGKGLNKLAISGLADLINHRYRAKGVGYFPLALDVDNPAMPTPVIMPTQVGRLQQELVTPRLVGDFALTRRLIAPGHQATLSRFFDNAIRARWPQHAPGTDQLPEETAWVNTNIGLAYIVDRQSAKVYEKFWGMRPKTFLDLMDVIERGDLEVNFYGEVNRWILDHYAPVLRSKVGSATDS